MSRSTGMSENDQARPLAANKQLHLGNDRQRNRRRPAAADVQSRRSVEPVSQVCARLMEFRHQALAPVGGTEKPDVGNVGRGKLLQITTIAHEMMAHCDRAIERRQIKFRREIICRHTQHHIRIAEITIVDVGLAMIDDGTSPAQFARKTYDRLRIEAGAQDQKARRRLDQSI